MTAPAPLTPADCDLRDFRNMPLDIQRFRDSDLLTEEEPETVLAALHLWIASWHQVPAASLPDDDRALAKFAGYGRSIAAWKAVREGALRGFTLCSDGRLYHDVVAEKALEAWDKRLRFQWAKAKDRHRKATKDVPEAERSTFPDFDDWAAGRRSEERPGKQGRLPLERDDSSAGLPTEEPLRTRAIGARAPARTGSRTVPSGNSSGNDDTFQRNGPSIPAENALKGREGKGVLEESTPLNPSTKTSATKAPPEQPDLVQLHDAVCEAAGYRPINPPQIAASMDRVKEWRERGYDFETVVLPAIRATVAQSKPDDRTRTLGRFRHAIAREAAKAGEAKLNGRAHVPTAVPILEPKGEDPRFVEVRKALLDRVGPATFVAAFNPVRFEAVPVEFGSDAAPLKITGPTFAVQAVRDNHRSAVLRAAKPLGFTDVWAN